MSPRRRRDSERGSALVEAAIVLPVLVLAILWSVAMTDVLILKIKSSEAARFALWETTVFREGPAIDADVRARFADLRSPAGLSLDFTGLALYPRARDLEWSASVDTAYEKVGLGGRSRLPPVTGSTAKLAFAALGLFTRSVDDATEHEGFNVYGAAGARVTLVRATHRESGILAGGDLLGRRGGNDLAVAPSMVDFSFQTPLPSQRPLRLVFDTWKAWPRPARFTPIRGKPTDLDASPLESYPVVEEQVSAQVGQIAFLGLKRRGVLAKISDTLSGAASSSALRTLLGGEIPDLLDTGRMDGGKGPRGPITILPVARPDVPWVPGNGLRVQRVGDLGTADERPVEVRGNESLTEGADRSRYTVPYRINTPYWTSDGGTDGDTRDTRLRRPPAAIGADRNGYTDSFRCRGHFFAGAVRPGEVDARRRYRPPCAP
ncbi:MAG: hypothetical protein NVSMB23_01790 [Myxococcales bacterium]